MGRLIITRLPSSSVDRILGEIKYRSIKLDSLTIKSNQNRLIPKHFGVKSQIITSKSHPISKHLLRLSNSSSYRRSRNSTLLTSKKLISDYCSLGRSILKLYTSSLINIPKGIQFSQLILVSKHILKSIVNVKSFHEGIIAEVPLPKDSRFESLRSEGKKRILAIRCRNRVEYHLGTLMRTALSMRWDGIWLIGDGNPDYLDPLTMRISQGSLYHIPFRYGSLKELVEFAGNNSLIICTTRSSINEDINDDTNEDINEDINDDTNEDINEDINEDTNDRTLDYDMSIGDSITEDNLISLSDIKNIDKGIILLVGGSNTYNYLSYCISITGTSHAKFPITIDPTTSTALVMYHI